MSFDHDPSSPSGSQINEAKVTDQILAETRMFGHPISTFSITSLIAAQHADTLGVHHVDPFGKSSPKAVGLPHSAGTNASANGPKSSSLNIKKEFKRSGKNLNTNERSYQSHDFYCGLLFAEPHSTLNMLKNKLAKEMRSYQVKIMGDPDSEEHRKERLKLLNEAREYLQTNSAFTATLEAMKRKENVIRDRSEQARKKARQRDKGPEQT